MQRDGEVFRTVANLRLPPEFAVVRRTHPCRGDRCQRYRASRLKGRLIHIPNLRQIGNTAQSGHRTGSRPRTALSVPLPREENDNRRYSAIATR